MDSLYLRSLLSSAQPCAVRLGRSYFTLDAVPHFDGVQTPRAIEDRTLWQDLNGNLARSGTMKK
jgi:hypothetical protein